MSDRQYAENFYSVVEGIAYNLLEGSDKEIKQELNEDYGIDSEILVNTPEEIRDSTSKIDLFEASLGISWRLSEKYFDGDEHDNKVFDSFRRFYEQNDIDTNGFGTKHLTQHVQLYSRIIDEEGLEVDPVTYSDIIQKNNEELSSELLETLEDMNEELSKTSDSLSVR